MEASAGLPMSRNFEQFVDGSRNPHATKTQVPSRDDHVHDDAVSQDDALSSAHATNWHEPSVREKRHGSWPQFCAELQLETPLPLPLSLPPDDDDSASCASSRAAAPHGTAQKDIITSKKEPTRGSGGDGSLIRSRHATDPAIPCGAAAP